MHSVACYTLCIEKDRGPSAVGARETSAPAIGRYEDKNMKELWIRNSYGEYTIMQGHFPFDFSDAHYTCNFDLESFKNKMIDFNARFEIMIDGFDNCLIRFDNETDAVAAKNWIEAQVIMNKLTGTYGG